MDLREEKILGNVRKMSGCAPNISLSPIVYVLFKLLVHTSFLPLLVCAFAPSTSHCFFMLFTSVFFFHLFPFCFPIKILLSEVDVWAAALVLIMEKVNLVWSTGFKPWLYPPLTTIGNRDL